MAKKIFKLLLLCLPTAFSAAGQTEGFRYKAPITNIRNSGFHNIIITPAINAHLKLDHSDLRIINSKGKWVPHLLRAPGTLRTAHSFLWDQRIVQKISNNNFTEIIIKTTQSKISDLIIETKNSDVERYCTLTGSDDSTNWFIINDSIQVRPNRAEEEDKSTLNINFPLNDYKFYKLFINNKGAAPFNILNVRSSGIISEDSSFTYNNIENPTPLISQIDSGNQSFVKITQKGANHIEKIALKISGVKYFYRKVDLYLPQSSSNFLPGQLLHSFVISNNSDLLFNVPFINADSFLLVIHNEDNRPLKLDEVKTYSNYRVATVYLEKEENYQMLMGNKDAAAAHFDLQELNMAFNKLLPEATIGAITGSTDEALTPRTGNKMLIWLVITIAAIALAFLTYKLISDMNKKERS